MPRLAHRLAFALGCLLLAAPGRAEQKITLCLENRDVLPWRNMALGGLNFELLKRVEKKLDVSFQYQLLPWKRCLARLKANEVDGAFTVSYSEERQQYGIFPGAAAPDPTLRMQSARYYLVRKKGSAIDWDGRRLQAVDGKIGFQLGYSIGELLRELRVPIDESKDTMDTVGRKLVTGRIAAAAVFDSDLPGLLQGPHGARLEMVGTPLVDKPYYLMLSRQLVATDPALSQRIWKAVEEVRDGREYGRLVQAAGMEHAR
jgi:polar amino acid transport system substrate-binding protein